MDDIKPALELLRLRPMPKLAAALRERSAHILARWDHLVHALLPNADALTSADVRNSIPRILEQMARALEADDPRPTEQLMEITKIHGEVRFHENYNMQELIEEYRLLRRILMEETDVAFKGVIKTAEWVALDMAIDIALQQAVMSFLKFQTVKLGAALGTEAKYLAFLAHDLRNGLNHIMLTMQWVEESIDQPEWKEHAQALRQARISAEETILSMERLLQAERLRKGVTAKRELAQLQRLGNTVAASFKNIAHARGLTLENRIPADATAHTDSGVLTVVLQNLVGNAVKYSETGTIQLAAHPLPAGAGWTVEVIDQGPGIAPDVLSNIFEAFQRGESHGQTGVGLGLYIASQGAKVLGGRIDVESTVGKGSTFRLHLPDLPVEGTAGSPPSA